MNHGRGHKWGGIISGVISGACDITLHDTAQDFKEYLEEELYWSFLKVLHLWKIWEQELGIWNK